MAAMVTSIRKFVKHLSQSGLKHSIQGIRHVESAHEQPLSPPSAIPAWAIYIKYCSTLIRAFILSIDKYKSNTITDNKSA